MSSTGNTNFQQHLKEPVGILPPGSSTSSQLGHSVVNLSNVHLYKDQIAALEKGLTFCPSPGITDITEIWTDLGEFFRRLRIRCYFDEICDQEDNDVTANKFKNKSYWSPPEGQDPTLDLFIKTVQNEVLKDDTSPRRRSNLMKKIIRGP